MPLNRAPLYHIAQQGRAPAAALRPPQKEFLMAEVLSPISKKGSKMSGNEHASSPGCRSNPSNPMSRRDAVSQYPDRPLPVPSAHSTRTDKPANLRRDG
jgi:hypothetical protein